MASKTTVVATFNDGSFIYRTTNVSLNFGWRAYGHNSRGRRYETVGFSSREDLAEKAANSVLRNYSHNPCGIEVQPVVVWFAKEWKVELVKRQPFRIRYTYNNGRSYCVGGEGNQDARWATREAAEARMNELKAGAPDGTTYEIVDDTPAKK